MGCDIYLEAPCIQRTRETLDLSSVGSYRGWSTHVEQEGEGCQEGVAPTGSGCPSSTCCACGTRRTPRHAARTPAAARARAIDTAPVTLRIEERCSCSRCGARETRSSTATGCGSRTCQRRGRCSCSPARNSLLGSWLSRAEVPHGIVSRRTCSPMNPTLCTAPSKSVLVRGRYALF